MKMREVFIKLKSKTIIYRRDNTFSTKDGILNLHPNKGTHWNFFIEKQSFDSYGCSPPKCLTTYVSEEKENVFPLRTR